VKNVLEVSGGRVLILVHRHELVAQWLAEARALDLYVGFMAPSFGSNPNPQAPIQIAMVQTLNRKLSAHNKAHRISQPSMKPFFPNEFDLIIADECHLSGSQTYRNIFFHYGDSPIIGLTATPSRLDGRGFAWASLLLEGPTHYQLVQADALVPFTTYSIDTIDYRSLRRIAGDWSAKSQGFQFESQPLIGNVVNTYLEYADGRSAITFASTVEHSKKLRDEYSLRGIPAAHLDGSTPTKERNRMIRDLDTGAIRQLCNVGVCTEGLNIRRVSCVSIAFATLSINRWRQAAGRSLRTFPGKKDALILDHGGNGLRHGNLDYEHKWDITPRTARLNKPMDGPAAKACPTCAAVMPSFAPTCEVCGEDLAPKERKLKTKEGRLKKLASGTAPVADSQATPRRSNKEKAAEITTWFKTL